MKNTLMLNEMLSEEDASKMWHEAHIAFAEEEKRFRKIKDEWRVKLKGLINIIGLWNKLNELDDWAPEGIVEVQLTDEKLRGYSSYQCAREVGGSPLYLKQSCEIRGVDHEYVYQVTGYLGDDYSGFLLFPLKDGKYFKVSYSC